MQSPEQAGQAFFPGFKWPVPRSFAAALAASRFELGDVLYRDPKAYSAWRGASHAKTQAIQVLHPPRSARGVPQDVEGDRRLSNWQSEVEVALLDLSKGEQEERKLTQGHLIHALRTGDPKWLEQDRAAPEMPLGARELAGEWAVVEPAMKARASKKRIRSGAQFLIVVDLAMDASLAKAATIENALSQLSKVDRIDWSPEAAGIEAPQRFHPTLELRALTVKDKTVAAVEAALRTVLYRGGTADSGPDAEAGGRFSVARHGLLVPVPR